jgi:hypothetical protein
MVGIMGHTLTTLLVFAKDEQRAYRHGKDVYDQLCKKESLWHYHLMGTNYDNGVGVYDTYPKAVLFDSPEGQKLIKKQMSGLQNEFNKNVGKLKALLTQCRPETLWLNGGKDIDVHCDHCHNNHTEYENVFWLCDRISDKDEFVNEVYAHKWGKIRSGYDLNSFLEEYHAAKEGKLTEDNKVFKEAVDNGKQLWIIPAYTKT